EGVGHGLCRYGGNRESDAEAVGVNPGRKRNDATVGVGVDGLRADIHISRRSTFQGAKIVTIGNVDAVDAKASVPDHLAGIVEQVAGEGDILRTSERGDPPGKMV